MIIGLLGFHSAYWGDDGDDILFPPPSRLSPLGNSAHGGNGDDVAVLVNGARDHWTPGASAQKVSIPAGPKCQLDIPVSAEDHDDTSKMQLNCPIVGVVDLQLNGKGTFSVGSDLHSSSFNLSPDGLRKFIAERQAGFPGDVCVCDVGGGRVPVLQEDAVY